MSTSERDRARDLERENRKLTRASDISTAAASHVAFIDAAVSGSGRVVDYR